MEVDTRLERLRLEMETAALWAQLEFLIPATHPVLDTSPSAAMAETKESQK
jgi:hypothetical protein